MKLLLLSSFFLGVNCSEQGDSTTGQEKDKASIDKLREEIASLAEASVCSETYTCFSIGVGSKPCGGHWEYLVYSNSIDVSTLQEKVEELNEMEKAYNEKYEVMSDCMMVMPPQAIVCEDGKCKGVNP